MSLQTFYLGDLNPSNWHEVFVFCLRYTDTFTVRFIGKDGELGEGFQAFFALPTISITNWAGVEDGFEISGSLTEEVRDLLYQLQEPAFYGQQPHLWDFKLLSQGREILSIGDFTDRLIYLTDEEMGFLADKQIDFSDWEAVAMAVAEEGAEISLDWDEEELQEVARLISHWLASDKKH